MTELLGEVLRANLAGGVGILLVFAIRLPVRRALGVAAAYRLWASRP